MPPVLSKGFAATTAETAARSSSGRPIWKMSTFRLRERAWRPTREYFASSCIGGVAAECLPLQENLEVEYLAQLFRARSLPLFDWHRRRGLYFRDRRHNLY